jgi:hypothetical protein
MTRSVIDEVYETVKRLHPEGRVYRFEHCGIVQPGSSPKKHCSACGAEIEGTVYEPLRRRAKRKRHEQTSEKKERRGKRSL